MNNIIKSTVYCDLMKQGKVDVGNSVYAIEEIMVKGEGEPTKEIRFAYYKRDINGKEKFVARPLDLEKDKLIALLKEGVKENIISKDWLKRVIDES